MIKKILCFVLVAILVALAAGCASQPSATLINSNSDNVTILLQHSGSNKTPTQPDIEIPQNYVLVSTEKKIYVVLNENQEILGYKKLVIDSVTNEYVFKDCDAKGVLLEDAQKITTLKFPYLTYEITAGETYTFTYIIEPMSHQIIEQTWTSSDETIAKVDEKGNLTAVAAGTATITLKIDGAETTCTVKVTTAPVPTTGISLSKTSATLKVGETLTLKATVKPNDATDAKVTWESSDTSTATVVDGKITALKKGTVTITAKNSGGQTATCKITIQEVPKDVATTGISLDKTSLTMTAGQTITLTATVKPSNATNKTVTWKTSDSSIATVSNGTVMAIKEGTVTITAQTSGGQTQSCRITVKAKVQPFGYKEIQQSECPLSVSNKFDDYLLSSSAKNVCEIYDGYTYIMIKAAGSEKISLVSVSESNGRITVKYTNSGTSNCIFIRVNKENGNIIYKKANN